MKIEANGEQVELTEALAHALTNAIRVAGERYQEDAKVCDTIPGHAGLAQQFRYQTDQARELAGLFERLGYC